MGGTTRSRTAGACACGRHFRNAAGQPVHPRPPASHGRVLRAADSTSDTEFTVPASPSVIALEDPRAAPCRASRARGAAQEAFGLLFSLPFYRAVVTAYSAGAPSAADAARRRPRDQQRRRCAAHARHRAPDPRDPRVERRRRGGRLTRGGRVLLRLGDRHVAQDDARLLAARGSPARRADLRDEHARRPWPTWGAVGPSAASPGWVGSSSGEHPQPRTSRPQ